MLYHIAQTRELQEAKKRGSYAPYQLTKQGYILCGYPQPLVRYANSDMRFQQSLVMIEFDEDLMKSVDKIKIDPDINLGEREFFRVYGPIKLDWIERENDLIINSKGAFEVPKSFRNTGY